MIIKRIRTGRRQVRGSVQKLYHRIGGLTNYVVDARDSELLGHARVRALTRYALDLADFGAEPGEKVSSYWSHNLSDAKLSEWQVQMTAVAALAVRGHDPVEHIVFSWRENEHPTDEQVKQAAGVILDCLGYGNCPAIGAAHVNTDKKHGHLAVVRIDPLNSRTAGDGWDIDRLHQAVAIVEERQGWAAEPNALYIARDGEVFCRVSGVLVRDRAGNQVKRARRSRAATPASLAPHIASIDTVLVRSASWAELHQGLEAVGIEYVVKGSGATIRVGEEVHKASALHPDLSRPKLERRLGPFEPNRDRGSPDYVRYEDDGRAELARIRDHEGATTATLNAHVAAALEARANDAASCASIGATATAARAQLKVAFGEAKARLKEQQLSHEDWKRAGRPRASYDIALPALLFPDSAAGRVHANRVGVPRFFAQHRSDRCDYLDGAGLVAFSDHGPVVIVHDQRPAAIDAALLLVAGPGRSRVRVFGSAAFVRLTLQRASALGIDAVVGPSVPAAAKKVSRTKSGPRAVHSPDKVPVPDAKPPLQRSLTARAPPAADQKPPGTPRTSAGTASRKTAEITSSQKENKHVRRTNRRDGLALVARVIDELHKPHAKANSSGAVARSSSRVRNLSIGSVVRDRGQDTSMLLSSVGRTELVPQIIDSLGMRRARHRLGIVGGEEGRAAAGLIPARQTTRGPAVRFAANATGMMADESAIPSVAEKNASATATAPEHVGKENVRRGLHRAPVTTRDELELNSTPTDRDPSAPGAFTESTWLGEVMPTAPAATEPRPTKQQDDDLRDQQLLQKLKTRGRGR